MHYVCFLNKSPVDQTKRSEVQVITIGGRNIDAGSMVKIRRRSLIAEYIACRVRAEWSYIFPLRKADFGSMPDLQPMSFAHAQTKPPELFDKPRHYFGCFGL